MGKGTASLENRVTLSQKQNVQLPYTRQLHSGPLAQRSKGLHGPTTCKQMLVAALAIRAPNWTAHKPFNSGMATQTVTRPHRGH